LNGPTGYEPAALTNWANGPRVLNGTTWLYERLSHLSSQSFRAIERSQDDLPRRRIAYDVLGFIMNDMFTILAEYI